MEAVRRAKRDGRPVIAVGTTSARTLEGAAEACAREGKWLFSPEGISGSSPDSSQAGWSGWTSIFIYPGFSFRVADGLITNFHLPESTLIMLVACMTGRQEILNVYRYAVEHRYRFFSFGDAMFITGNAEEDKSAVETATVERGL